MKNFRVQIFILIMLFSFSAYAQYGSVGITNARSMGLGRTYNSVSTGIFAVGINPANLTQSNTLEITTVLPLPAVSIRTGTNFISLEDINYFFGGVNGEARYLTEADKEKFNSLFEQGGAAFLNANAGLFSVSFKPKSELGTFAFSINDFTSTKVNIPEALIDIALTGNPVGKTFNLDDADIKSWWIRTYSLSYAREIPGLRIFQNFAAGITLKYVQGFSYIGTQKNNTTFTTGSNAEVSGQADIVGYSAFSDNFGVKYDFDTVSQKSKLSLFPNPAGTGYGFDAGFSASLNNNWMISLSVTDIGKIKWTENVAEFKSFGYIYLDDIADKDQRDSLKETITGDSRSIKYIKTNLPTTLRFGTSYLIGKELNRWPGSLLVAFDYNQGFNEMPGNSLEPRFSIGTEWKPMDWIPFLRTGFSYGGGLGFCWAFGLGIDAGIVELHFATSDMQSVVLPNKMKTVSVSLGSRWKF